MNVKRLDWVPSFINSRFFILEIYQIEPCKDINTMFTKAAIQ